MKNWQALGQPAKAEAAKTWFLVSMAVIAVLACASIFASYLKMSDAIERTMGLFLLLAWYFCNARDQTKYVRTHIGNAYPRRGWFEPLAVAILVSFGIGVAMGVLALLLRSLA